VVDQESRYKAKNVIDTVVYRFGDFSNAWVSSLIQPHGVAGLAIFGLITSAIPYSMARGTRDFSSTMQLVAGRYDVLCDPRNAEHARDLLARLAI